MLIARTNRRKQRSIKSLLNSSVAWNNNNSLLIVRLVIFANSNSAKFWIEQTSHSTVVKSLKRPFVKRLFSERTTIEKNVFDFQRTRPFRIHVKRIRDNAGTPFSRLMATTIQLKRSRVNDINDRPVFLSIFPVVNPRDHPFTLTKRGRGEYFRQCPRAWLKINGPAFPTKSSR